MAAKVNIKVLQAREGDCIFITISDDDKSYIIMVDSGVKSTYQYKDKGNRICNGPLKDEIDELRKNQRFIDLVILTHVDDDHIGGINVKYLQPIITQYFIDNKSEIWLLFLIAHSKR